MRLDTQTLNRTVLARQLLLERAGLDVPTAIERVSGLQTQYAPTGYVGLWSRVAGFERARLTDALESRDLVQATMMRATIHLVSRDDYWPLTAAVRAARRAWWVRVAKPPSERAMADAAARARELLLEGPRRRTDLVATLDLDTTTWNGLGTWLDLVRVPPSGTWDRRRADLFCLAETWVGPAPSETPDAVARSMERLVTRYLTGFGPASRKDVQSFTGLPASTVDAALAAVAPRRFATEDGVELFDLEDAPLAEADARAPVRLLGPWEAVLLAHARRADVLPERHRPRVFSTKLPQSVPTVLVDGRVAGSWRFADGQVRVEPFEPWDDDTRAAVAAEAAALAAFHV